MHYTMIKHHTGQTTGQALKSPNLSSCHCICIQQFPFDNHNNHMAFPFICAWIKLSALLNEEKEQYQRAVTERYSVHVCSDSALFIRYSQNTAVQDWTRWTSPNLAPHVFWKIFMLSPSLSTYTAYTHLKSPLFQNYYAFIHIKTGVR